MARSLIARKVVILNTIKFIPTRMPCAVILTTLAVEYLAVRAHLSHLQEEIHAQGTIYERGKFAANGQAWDVIIVEIGPGNFGAALEAERAISYFSPEVILLVGVAGGIKDVAIGDVVVSTKVYGYEFGKAEATFKSRPEIGLAAYRLEKRARVEARKSDWLGRLGEVPVATPKVFVAPIAAGEKVVVSTQSEVFQFLRSHYEDAIAIEMEGFGFLAAVRSDRKVDAIVIRGISDLIDGKTEADRAGAQEIAACHASAFAFQMLSKLEFGAAQETELAKQNGMSQKNSDHAKGWQTVVEGGTAYIGEIHFHGTDPQVPSSLPPLPAAAPRVKAQAKEIEVFFSYAHEDEALRDKLETHLKTLQRQRIIRQWHDRQIGAGKEWAGEIDQHLESAQIILLLVSADFIASDYCFDKEVKRAMERHRTGTARVIPVILRAVDLDGVPFNQLQSLPRDRIPVTSWRNQDEAFTDIAKGIRAVVKEIVSRDGDKWEPPPDNPRPNPFIVGSPVPAERFYGRQSAISTIRNRMGAKDEQCVNIIGHFSSGKTSLLNYIQTKEHQDKFFYKGQNPVIVKLDLEESKFHSPLGVTEGLRCALEEQLNDSLWSKHDSADQYKVNIGLSRLKNQGYRLVVMFDNFDRIKDKLSLFQGAWGDWRSKANRYLLAMVIVSSRPLNEIYKELGLSSPFSNIFTSVVLGGLEKDDWHQILINEFNVGKITDERLTWVESITGGLPFYVQMAASALWQFDSISIAEDQFREESYVHFKKLWDSLNEKEKNTLFYIAGISSVGKEVSHEGLTKRLKKHGILKNDGSIFSHLFIKFLKGLN